MDESTKPYRYWLTILLDDLPAGTFFDKHSLHISVVPWFVLEANEEKFLESFYSKFENLPAFDAQIGETAHFGGDKDIVVNLVHKSEQIQYLHRLALDWLEENSTRWAVKEPQVFDKYVPHVRRRHGKWLEKGEVVHVKALTLVRALRHEDDKRYILAKALLYG